MRELKEILKMNNTEIIAELEAMVWHRLFNCRRWLADRETAWAVHQKLIKMGLVEQIFARVRGAVE